MSRVLPILFNTEMTKATLEGRKTVTRRLIKPRSKNACGFYVTTSPYNGSFMGVYDYDENEKMFENSQTPPCQVGDILYVRETWKSIGIGYVYKMDWERQGIEDITKWRPSIHMPKEAARIFLEVTDVRVERLKDITEEQCCKEGLSPYDDRCHDDNWKPTFYDPDSGGSPRLKQGFEILWNSTVKEEWQKFESNPYVWVIEFERCEKPSKERED